MLKNLGLFDITIKPISASDRMLYRMFVDNSRYQNFEKNQQTEKFIATNPYFVLEGELSLFILIASFTRLYYDY